MGRELKLLLDTHTLLYALVEPERLSPQTRELLTNPSNRRLVNVASLWEIAIKHQLGRLPQGGLILAGYPGWLQDLKAQELPILGPHAILAPRLPGAHRDPFDRMLAAQSLLEGALLLTHDPALKALGADTFW